MGHALPYTGSFFFFFFFVVLQLESADGSRDHLIRPDEKFRVVLNLRTSTCGVIFSSEIDGFQVGARVSRLPRSGAFISVSADGGTKQEGQTCPGPVARRPNRRTQDVQPQQGGHVPAFQVSPLVGAVLSGNERRIRSHGMASHFANLACQPFLLANLLGLQPEGGRRLQEPRSRCDRAAGVCRRRPGEERAQVVTNNTAFCLLSRPACL